jgi:hypothetical protein
MAAISSIEAGSITHSLGSGADGYVAVVAVCAIVESAATRDSRSMKTGMLEVRPWVRGTAIFLSRSLVRRL